MPQRQPEILAPDPTGIARAAELLASGALVAIPTETVYGLAADARNGVAVAAIFEAKGRPSFNPLIVHVADLRQAEEFAVFSDTALALAQAFWPGPLTLVLPQRRGTGIAKLATAGLDTLAIRVPAHDVAQALLRRFGGPVAAPSANPSGRISPTSGDHVIAGLGPKVAAILDAGPTPVGLESTILAVEGERVRLLRQGGVPQEALEPLTGPLSIEATPGGIEAPGQLASHYAPKSRLEMDSDLADPAAIRVGFGPGAADLSLSPAGDLREAAARLFAVLHQADAMAEATGKHWIAVAPIPEVGLGRAINDRLRRASA